MKARAIPLILLAATAAASAQTASDGTISGEGMAHLLGMLEDPAKANGMFAALRTTENPALVPLFTALTRSGDKKRRLFGVVALAGLDANAATPVLLERIKTDPFMAVRAEALGRLLEAGTLTDQQIADALAVSDENVQCLAARALVDRRQAGPATPWLRKLATSADEATALLAKTCLLGLGKREHAAAVGKVLRDPQTPATLLATVLEQIEKQKIAPAVGFVLELARQTTRPMHVRVAAYKTAAAVSKVGAAALGEAVAANRRSALGVRLLKILADRDDAGGYLPTLAEGDDPVGVLARFELARKVGGPGASRAALEAVKLEHPVVVAYILDRAGADVQADGDAAFYVPALDAIVRSVEPRPRRMRKEHYLAAGAAARLIEIGTPEAIAAIKKLLEGRTTARTRAVAAGLLRAKNPAARDLVRPLLQSPYEELAIDAALALGHFGDPAAAAKLRHVVANAKRHPDALAVLASWYLLKIDGKIDEAVAKLAARLD